MTLLSFLLNATEYESRKQLFIVRFYLHCNVTAKVTEKKKIFLHGFYGTRTAWSTTNGDSMLKITINTKNGMEDFPQNVISVPRHILSITFTTTDNTYVYPHAYTSYKVIFFYFNTKTLIIWKTWIFYGIFSIKKYLNTFTILKYFSKL